LFQLQPAQHWGYILPPGVLVNDESVAEWNLGFSRLFAATSKGCRPKPGNRRQLGEIFLHMFRKLLHGWELAPQVLVTDKIRNYVAKPAP
jgi:hypothetical protein